MSLGGVCVVRAGKFVDVCMIVCGDLCGGSACSCVSAFDCDRMCGNV